MQSFGIRSTDSTPTDEAYFAAVGRFTTSWALLEAALDFTIAFVHHYLDGDQIEKKRPWPLNRKVKYLRKCFRELPDLVSGREAMEMILDDVTVASELRHDIVHGFVIAHAESSGQTKMARLIRGDTPLAHKPFSVTTEQILAAALTVDKLAAGAMDLPGRWGSALMAESLRRAD